MEFSLSSVFVVPTDNTLPVAGTTATLTPGQVGVFLPNYTPATAANAGAATHLFVAEGRDAPWENLPTYKSDWFSSKNIISAYLIEGSDTVAGQITEVSDFSFKCDNSYSITLRGWSNDINASYFNGMTVPITVKAPCCDCDADPCADLDAAGTEALVDEFIEKINANSQLSPFVTATKTGTGLDTVLVLTGVVLEADLEACNLDPYTKPYVFDAFRFEVYAEVAAPTTQDLYVEDGCNTFATVTKTQEISLPIGTPAQVQQVEAEWQAYKRADFKTQYRNYHFNKGYVSKVEDIPYYNQIYIRFQMKDNHRNFGEFVHQESNVTLFVAPAQTAAIQAILEAQVGTLEVKS